MTRRLTSISLICLLVFGGFIGNVNFISKEVEASNWIISSVDNLGYVGQFSSIALDSNGYPHISYGELTCYPIYDLKYAKWDGDSWIKKTIEKNAGRYKMFSSIALDSENNPHISYVGYSEGSNYLKYAKFNGIGWEKEFIGNNSTSTSNSLALDSKDNPHICYQSSGNLSYAKWNGNNWIFEIVDSTVRVAGRKTIKLDTNDYPHISYTHIYDNSKRDLKYSRWNGSAWINMTVDNTGELVDLASMALDNNDFPHICYKDDLNDTLKYAKWNGSKWIFENVDSGGLGSLALDQNNRAHISYSGNNGHLKYAYWKEGNWSIEIVDNKNGTGNPNSIVIDNYGFPHISYFSYFNSALKYVKMVDSPGPKSIFGRVYTFEGKKLGVGFDETYVAIEVEHRGIITTYIDGLEMDENGDYWFIITIQAEDWKINDTYSIYVDGSGWGDLNSTCNDKDNSNVNSWKMDAMGSEECNVYTKGKDQPPGLQITITSSKTEVLSGDTSTITVHVRDGANPVQGASVSLLSLLGGAFDPAKKKDTTYNGLTNTNGIFKASYQTPIFYINTEDTLGAFVTKEKYSKSWATITIHIISTDNFTSFSINTLWNINEDTYHFENPSTIWAGGGNCYGISSSELLYFRHYELNDNIFPYFPAQSSTISNTHDLRMPQDIKNTVNNVSLAIMIHQIYGQKGYQDPKDLETEFIKMNSSLSSGIPVILGLGPNNPHAVIAWSLRFSLDGTVYINISDPNSPDLTTFARYDFASKEFQYVNGHSWPKFIVLDANIIDKSWFGIRWSNPLEWWMPWQDWVTLQPDGYRIIVSNKMVDVYDPITNQINKFTESGNSQTFVMGIQGSSGIEEGNMQVYAIPDNIRPIIKDPAVENSELMITWIDNLSEGRTGHGFAVNISSDGQYDYEITPSNDGFSLIPIDSTITLHVAIFSAEQQNFWNMKAININIEPGKTAEFVVKDWTLLNNTTESSVILNIYGKEASTPEYSYDLYNGMDGLPTSQKPIDKGQYDSLLILVSIIALVIILGGVLIYRKRKQQTSQTPQESTQIMKPHTMMKEQPQVKTPIEEKSPKEAPLVENAPKDHTDRMRKLKEMKDQGLITEQDFEDKKEKILKEL